MQNIFHYTSILIEIFAVFCFIGNLKALWCFTAFSYEAKGSLETVWIKSVYDQYLVGFEISSDFYRDDWKIIVTHIFY